MGYEDVYSAIDNSEIFEKTNRKSVVYKYLIPFQEWFTMNLKDGSKVVRIDVAEGNPYMWVLTPLGDDIKTVKYHFKSSKTGGVIEHTEDLVFIDTYAIFIQMELMLYVFLEKVTDENDLLLVKADDYVNNCWRC